MVLLLVVTLLGGGYFGYKYWFEDLNINVWSLVPADSFLVLEINDLGKVRTDLDSINTWQALQSIPTIEEATGDLQLLDSLAGQNEEFERLFKNNPLLVTVNVIAKDAFDLLYLFEVKNIQQHSIITNVIDSFDNQYQKSTRKYLNYTITEIKAGNRLFTYIYYKNFFVGSFTPFLVEDVIRTLDDETIASFPEAHRDLFSLVKMEQDQGNIYINSKKLDRALQVFVDDVKANLAPLGNIAARSFLDLRFEDNAIDLNGFSIVEDDKGLLSHFKGNTGVAFDMLNLIPENTAWIYHLSFQNSDEWLNKWRASYVAENAGYQQQIRQLESKYDLSIESTYQWLGNAVALVVTESAQPDQSNRLLILDANDIGEAYAQLNLMTERMARVDRDSVFSEPFRNYEIRQLKIENFPELLFGPQFNEFSTTYYLPLEGRIVMANNLQLLTQLLDDITNENNWGKSVKINQFFDQLNREANVNLIVDTNRSWKTLMQFTRPTWIPFFEENAPLLRSFEHLAIQFSAIDDKFYTNIVITQPEGFDQSQSPGNITVEKTVSFPYPLVGAPQFGRSHIDRKLELVVQDSSGTIYHVDNDLEVLWSEALTGRINSEVYQIDYYKNQKLQFLFSTPEHIYGFDRVGGSLPKYPLSIAKGKTAFFNIIDYNKTKDYRLLLANTEGDLYLMDKGGETLGAWQPLPLGSPLAIKPFHLRVNSRDLIIAPLSNGVVHARNRRGDSYRGFPLDLKESLAPGIFIKTGANFTQSRLTMVTQTGSIIEFNLEGAIFRRDQLLKPEVNSSFRLVKDALDKDYIILRRDETRIGILDQNGNILFEKDYLSAGAIQCQYYNFGAGNEVVIIIDTEQEFAYLYDKRGRLLNFKPLETGQEIGLLYSEANSQYEIYKIYDNELSRLTMNR